MYRIQLLEESVTQGNKEILAIESPYQTIEFERGLYGLSLFLNREVQFTEAFERGYHDALAGTAMRLNPRAQKVLIMGGGDGLAARTIFEHQPYARIALAELDPMMVSVSQFFKPMASLNQGALFKTQNIIGDARQTVRGFPPWSVDVVLCDFPDKKIDTESLYNPVLYSECHRVLKPGGVISIYPGGDMFRVRNSINAIFGNARTYATDIGDKEGTMCQIVQGVKKCIA